MSNKFSYVITNSAEHDLEEIFDYINFALFNPSAAAKLYDEILIAIDNIRTLPKGYPMSEYTVSERILYKYFVRNYTIFYSINEELQRIEISRVIYSERNFDEILREVNKNIKS